MNVSNSATVGFHQHQVPTALHGLYPAFRPAASVLGAVIFACTLTACGESGSGSDAPGQAASALSAGGTADDQAVGSTDGADNGRGVAIGDVNVSSAAAVNASGDGTIVDDASGGPATKATVATMSKLPSFGVGPFTAGAAVIRVIGTYPGGKPIAGRRYRNNVLIAGGTSASYTIVAADAGQQLVYEELVERYDNKVQAWFRSAAVAVPTPDPTMTTAPSLGAGALVSGSALTRVMGVYPGSTPVAGRRYRNNVLIAGATGASYSIVAADLGQQLVYEEEAQRNDTGNRKWFRSAVVLVPKAGPDLSIISDPPTFNTAENIVADMKLRNDFVLKGYESFKNGWYVGPGVNAMGNNPNFDTSQATWSIFYNNPSYTGKVARAALPWVVIFDGVDHAASNVGVEMRNMLTYIKSRASGKWVLFGGPANTSGTLYGKPNTGLPAMNEVVLARTATSSTIKVPENRGYFWHGWWAAGRLAVDPYDIAAMFVTIQARLVVADASRGDDRARAQVGLQVGADYYMTTSSIYPESYAPAVGINRTKKITNDWQAYNFTTFSDVGVQDPGGGITEAAFRAAPPPLQ